MRQRLCLRRCPRFTLRGLLCVITIICVWASLNANRAHHQREAVNAVIQLGGEVTYDFDSLAESDGFVRSWMRRIAFYCFCEPVVQVDLSFCDVEDSNLSCFENPPQLKALRLGGNARLSGRGLRYIQGLDGIELLSLTGTGITDRDIHQIVSLRNVRELELSNTTIGDRGVSLLRQLPNIEKLELCATGITDDALQSVRDMSQLAELVVVDTRVTDVGLRELEGMQSLRKLHLAGFVYRRGKIALLRCGVSAEGAADFERKVPWCEVQY